MINVKLYILSNAREGVGSTLFNPAYRSVFYLTTMYSDFCQVIRCCSEIVSLILGALQLLPQQQSMCGVPPSSKCSSVPLLHSCYQLFVSLAKFVSPSVALLAKLVILNKSVNCNKY